MNKRKKTKHHIYTGGDFEKLVTESTIFADKSLFIQEILETPSEVILITMPRRWGKSINMDMLKRFLEVKVDEQGNLSELKKKEGKELFFGNKDGLKPLKISQTLINRSIKGKNVESLSEDYQGTYPVIRIGFKDCKGSNLTETRSRVQKEIISTYEAHAYLNTSKYVICLKEIQEWDTSKEDTSILTFGLKNLSRLLYQHFNKKVWVLVDEYDAPINNAFMKFEHAQDTEKVVDLFRGVFESVFKENEYLEKGFITGVNRIAKANMFSGLNNVREYNFQNARIAQYYGLDEEELTQLFEHFNIPKELKEETKNWYNGYRVKKVGSNEHIDKYNIWSIVNYLNNDDHTSFGSYWEESGNIDFIKKLFKLPLVKSKIDRLVKNEAIVFRLKEQISSEDFKILKTIMDLGSNCSIDESVTDILFSYLFAGGYLTVKSEKEFKLPNKEIRNEFQNKLLDHYKQQYNINVELFTNVTDQLQKVLDSKIKEDIEKAIEGFKESFRRLLTAFPKFEKITDENIGDAMGQIFHGNEDLVHCVLSYITLQLKSISKFATEIYLGSGRSDIVFTDALNKKGAVIEIKYNGDASEAIQQVKDKDYTQKLIETMDTFIVGVNISENKKVDVQWEYAFDRESAQGTLSPT